MHFTVMCDIVLNSPVMKFDVLEPADALNLLPSNIQSKIGCSDLGVFLYVIM